MNPLCPGRPGGFYSAAAVLIHASLTHSQAQGGISTDFYARRCPGLKLRYSACQNTGGTALLP